MDMNVGEIFSPTLAVQETMAVLDKDRNQCLAIAIPMSFRRQSRTMVKRIFITV